MPTKPINIKDLFKTYQKKVSFIDDYLGIYDAELRQLQRELAMIIVGEYIPQFETVDGNLVLNEKNARLLGDLDNVFADFKDTFATNVFKTTGEKMLSLTGMTSEYFRQMNFSSKTLANITDKLGKMQFTIGIDSKGNVLKGSFIDNLASTPQAKSLLSDYVRKAIEGEMPYKDFASGFKEVIEGTKDVKGSLVRYAEGYVHDSMYAHSQSVDNFFAEELKLDCFYYAGDQIKTTRPFCAARFGKIFTKEDGESWQDLDWQGKITGEDFFTQRGGYNCRHNLMWVPCEAVTEEEMNKLDPNT